MEQFEFEKQKRKRIRREPIYIICCILCLIIGSGVGYFLGYQPSRSLKTDGIYEESAQLLEKYFYDLSDSEVSLEERMLYGMSSFLDDPYTTYFTDEGSEEYNQKIEGSFVGIGVEFVAVSAGGLIMNVFDNSPAYKAGLLSGDMITHVEGTSVEGLNTTKIQEKVLGESGSKVSLTILRNGKSMNVDIVRNQVESSLSYEIKTIHGQKVGLITLTTFGQGTVDLFEEALKEFQKNKVSCLCIDLRDNGGGYLESVVNLVSFLVPKDQVIMRTQDKNNKTQEYKSRNCTKYHFDKGYIFMNEKSASSSEVMIGALTELLNYQTIGEKTFGKGVIQNQFTLSNSSVLKITTRKWLTPEGKWIHKNGFDPQYKIEEEKIDTYLMNKLEKSYQYNDVDEQVITLQECLKKLNYHVDRTDGYFSKATQEALKTFEKDYSLKVNGIYEKNDATLLLSATAYQIFQQTEDQALKKLEELLK